MELGVNYIGEIVYIMNFVKLDVVIIVNVVVFYLEGFGSLLGVVCVKSEIFKGLGSDGVVVVNVDS